MRRKSYLILFILVGISLCPPKVSGEEASFSQDHEKKAEEYFRKGHAYYLEAEADKAEAEFRKALGLEPQLWLAHYYLGSIYFKQDRYVEAKEECVQALEINPEDINSLIILGLSEHHLGADEEAVRVFQRACALDPQSTAAHSALGLAYCATGDLEKAKQQYFTLNELDADLADDLYQRIKGLEDRQAEQTKE